MSMDDMEWMDPRIAVRPIVAVMVAAVLWLAWGSGGTSFAATDGGGFRARVAEMAAASDGLAVPGLEGWLFLTGELRFAGHGQFWGPAAADVSRATDPAHADPLPAIVGFHEGLAAKGIELLVVPVPPKVVVFPDRAVAGAEPARMDEPIQAFYGALREHGVHVLDLTDALLADRLGERGPIYCRTDTHWAPRACETAAEAIAAWIRDRGSLPGSVPGRQEILLAPREIVGDLAAGGAGQVTEKEVLSAGVVGDTPIASDPTSPVILMGDSHTLVFSDGLLHGDRAGLADHLSHALGMPLDLSFRNRGSGSTVVRTNLLRQQIRSGRDGEDYLAGKKVVVWCFAARELSESTAGWRVLPVTP